MSGCITAAELCGLQHGQVYKTACRAPRFYQSMRA
jgi:hypothetical protein